METQGIFELCYSYMFTPISRSYFLVLVNRNRDLLLKVGKENITTMQSIIQKMPKVASEVMNTCIKKSSTFDREGKNIYTIVYDFTLLEPGEELEEMYNLPKGIHNLNALTTIVSSNHVGLLEHPLSARLLDTKWSHFGRRVYVFNLMINILFIVALTAYVLNIEDYFNSAYSKVHLIGLQPSNAFSGNGKPASRSISAFSNSTSNGTVIDDIARNHSSIPILKALILVFSIVNLIREIFQLYHEKWKYFLSYENYFEIALHTSVIAFAVGPGTSSYFWAIGTFSVQLAYIELVMFLRKLPVIGKYVLMIRSMVNTILKVMIIVFIFVMGFAIGFGMQCLHEVAFSNIFLSVIKVIDMMVGEIDYKDVFLSGIQNGDIAYPGSYAVLVILLIFIFIMSILVMNLMIGLAVGDIAEMEKKAKLRRLADLTDYFYNIDKIMSRHLRKQYKIDKITCTEVERITTVDKSNSNECLFESHNSEISSQMQEMVRQFESQRMRLIAMEEKLRFICQNMDDTSTS
ncbi:uncharacterized protein TRIADDRAFT_53529 [Trichoplax adhaerens]|uniref:Ion transport domain-containing protein n=1 Tax=Trichoplax adhaerens TaxID=10228 RepID=B3RPG5_TRIAD|nr:hypothetical protein TRIADDRAFT_53529 [Trichoplax adhaerens]EDV27631.1 hypothetical protein TRIADDRAFT_53529 [Trichoplax adhaerens]|eukprot:XP_002109465.1 hypothetical protein TRIADDRAFT_53529 [Trichoplax adhaerens]